MSKLRSSLSPPRVDTTQEPIYLQPTSFSNGRSSWAPSLHNPSQLDEHDRQRDWRSRSSSRPSSRLAEHATLGAEPSSVTLSLLSSRRPVVDPSLPESFERARKRRVRDFSDPTIPEAVAEPASPDDGGNFRRSLQIDMKGLVGDAVGNMSISPSSRDVVLAARRGLFVIDLESPLEVPRFLPQGGTWDVADVQWNPHPSRAEYIVSTSSEKLLIWNLRLGGKTAIEHILKSHYRAITDINWHTTEPDTVVSTGIDSWIWAWDLREPRKPIFGMSAFNSGGTQVKWNRQDPNILASSHAEEVFIWDRRKGCLPVRIINGHAAKIYGIDWSHQNNHEIVTCSLDKTIKTWDIDYNLSFTEIMEEPISSITTTHPVWRARYLPFGEGLLSIAQRGETGLKMYGKGESQTPVETFEGHTDVVKEFVWRRGGQDEFQLITWSKDRTLRFWPVDAESMGKVGHTQELSRGRQSHAEKESTISFRKPPETEEQHPALSAPVGVRSILAEVRAPMPPRPTHHPVLQPHLNSTARASALENSQVTPTIANSIPIAMSVARKHGETMSRGNLGGKSVAKMDAFTWLSNVKVGERRSSSSGPGSEVDSPGLSRINSLSRLPSGQNKTERPVNEVRKRSDSRNRAQEDRKDGEASHSLQDEITSVITKLAASKIKLEKHDLAKKRTCTLGMQGPWGDSSSVFIRVTFTFPREYPHGIHPDGTPVVELERNPLISIRSRAFILKRLRSIRQRKRPCLEACLRFLIFGSEDGQSGHSLLMDSESSDDEGISQGLGGKPKEVAVSIMRNHKNLMEPRTSQGTFGPDGEFVCFFRAPHRVVRHVIRGAGIEPIKIVEEQQPLVPPPEPQKRMFQAPALLSDAVRRLSLAATDRVITPVDAKRAESGNILRITTNLLTISKHKQSRNANGELKETALREVESNNWWSSVFMSSTNVLCGSDKTVAKDYIFQSDSLADVCEKNAVAAYSHGRHDHERIFRIVLTLFRTPKMTKDNEGKDGNSFSSDNLARKVIMRIYDELSRTRDLQMLAMLAVLILQIHVAKEKPPDPSISLSTATPRSAAPVDYFTFMTSAYPLTSGLSPTSPAWPRLPSPSALPLATSTSSNSSRGSWSSLFNAGSMRQFVTGVHDTLKDGLNTPADHLATSHVETKETTSGLKHNSARKGPPLYLTPTVSKSWGDTISNSSKLASVSFLSPGHRRPSALRIVDPQVFVQQKKRVVFRPPSPPEIRGRIFDPAFIEQLHLHVYAYAELLFRWQFYNQRTELIKAVKRPKALQEKSEGYQIGLVHLCKRCRGPLGDKKGVCETCAAPRSLALCTICRLPVKGLSRSCLRCHHVSHISCWNTLDVPICPSGCGCFCNGIDSAHTRPSTRLALSPNTGSINLPPTFS